jgi:hypothetical protein
MVARLVALHFDDVRQSSREEVDTSSEMAGFGCPPDAIAPKRSLHRSGSANVKITSPPEGSVMYWTPFTW